jgi:hypothetical protein
MSENQAALVVAGGIFVLVGGLKAALWPWLLRRRSWARRAAANK